MNYAKSRQREDDKLWDWTVMNDRVIERRSGPCSEACVHKTAAEADRHLYDWSLSKVQEHEDKDTQRKCQVCDEWTNKWFGNDQFWMLSLYAELCDKHRNLNELQLIHPFKPPYELIYS